MARRVRGNVFPWLVGNPLSLVGMSVWEVSVAQCTDRDWMTICIGARPQPLPARFSSHRLLMPMRTAFAGVCDARTTRFAWGLDLHSQAIKRVTRNDKGKIQHSAAAPDGYPEAGSSATTKDAAHNENAEPMPMAALEERSGGERKVVEVRVDHDSGKVSFRVLGQPSSGRVIHGFPRGGALRPWVSSGYLSDQFTLVRPFVQHQQPVRA